MTTSTTEPPEVTQAEREENHNPSDVISVEITHAMSDGTSITAKATVPVDVYSPEREIQQAGLLMDELLMRFGSPVSE